MSTAVVRPGDVNVDAILATIRALESGGGNPAGNYTIHTSGGSDASGAYQYTTGTWDVMFHAALNAGALPAGTPFTVNAADAPKAVQDAVARYDVTTFLASVGGDVSQVPKHWYYPVSVGNHNYDNFTPPGNNITIGQYQNNWLNKYGSLANLSAAQLAAVSAGTFTGSGSSGTQSATLTGVSLPGLGAVGDAIKGLFSPLIKYFTDNAFRVVQFVIGLGLIALGVNVVLNDLKPVQEAKQAAGPALMAAAAA